MADENFPTNILRMMAAEMHFQTTLIAAREMFGRGYFSLGQAEKIAVDQAVLGFVSGNYGSITPEYLAGQESRPPMGFGIPKGDSSIQDPSSGS